jgi:hypothetical protein
MMGIGTADSLPGARQDATVARGAEPHMMTLDTKAAAAGGAATVGHQAVLVPLNRRALVPTPAERVRRIRAHLVRSLRDLRTMKQPERNASPLRPEPGGFAGVVARGACALCGGYCCKGGAEHAYLDERDMARVRQARPGLEARAVIRLYMERVPAEGYAGSCVFHGRQGCTLDRSLRSDVCNSYFCNELRDFVATANAASSVVVTAAAADGETRLSPVLTR